MPDLSPVVLFSIGLLGGAHCLGMCGPIVMLYSRSVGGEGTVYRARQYALLNLGRVTIYTLLGGLFGLAGGFVGSLSFWRELNAYVATVVGLAILLYGFRYLMPGLYRVTGIPRLLSGLYSTETGFFGFVSDRIVAMKDLASGPGIYFLGFLHGFLPCPITLPPLLYAFAVGDPLTGMAIMAFIGLGTFPTMFLFGLSHRRITADRRGLMLRVLGLLLIVLGLVPLLHGLKLLGLVERMIHIPVYQPFSGGM